MRNGLAEWVISRAAGPEQAATIVGDLLEAELGTVAFWLAVSQTTVSIARHQPRRIVLHFFWLVYDLCFYAFLGLILARMPEHGLLLIAAVTTPYLGVSWAVDRRRESSQLPSAAFFIWLLGRDGVPPMGHCTSDFAVGAFRLVDTVAAQAEERIAGE